MSKGQLLLTTLLSGAVFGSVAAPAFAQANDDEIVVTGSRIKKKDFTSNSPVATVDAVQFERSGAINTENLLNTLPQTVPGLDRTSNNPGNGSATVDLRGLGSNRTLVLVNGTRQVPFGQNGVVDLNTIPSSLISSVEVLTGGASSVYGADAVAGVVNFIYKDDFEGVEANMGYQITDSGDAGLFNTDVTIGANFDDGKGNVVFNASYANRDPLFQGDRDFSRVAFFDDGNGGLEPGGSSGVPGTSIFSTFDYGGGVTGPGTFEADGTLRPFVLSGQVNDFYNYAPVNFIQLPQERFTLTTLGQYEINENVEVYARGSFSTNKVDSELAPTPIFQTSTFTLDGNPFINAGSQQVISDTLGLGTDTDGDGIDDQARGFLRRRLVEVGPRQTKDDNQAFQITVGARGNVFGSDTWDYDVYIQEGRTLRSQVQNGNVNRGRFDQALVLATDAAGNVILDANGNPSCSDGSSNGGVTGCSPLNIFGPGNISDASAEFISTRANARSTFEQTVVAANFSGDFGGLSFTDTPVGVAFGGEYIENEAAFDPSQDVAASTIAGFNGSPPSGGRYDVYSAYGEMSVPLLEDVSFAQNITLDLAGRVSNFSTAGTTYNYKVGGEWAINDQIRLRGNYNTATRAPNIGELFAPIGEGFPGAQDPCSSQGAPVSSTVSAICVATGVPAGTVGSNTIDTISGQVRALSGGNPNLDVETAKTITFGVVLKPAAIEGFSLSVDYYDIVINDAIAAFGGGANNVLDVCYNQPQGGAGSDFCNVITRRADGSIENISLQAQNVAQSSVAGIDIAANYGFDTSDVIGSDFGRVDLAYLGTYNLENNFLPFVGGTLIECAGDFGVTCGEPDPTYRHRMVGTWSKGNLSAQTVWRLVGGVNDDDDGNVFTVDSISARNYFDTSITWDAAEALQLTFGMNNIFDKAPPTIGDNDEQANTYPASYDVFGRTFFANAKVRF